MGRREGGRDVGLAPPAAPPADVVLAASCDVDATPGGVHETRAVVRSTLAEWAVDPAAANAVLDVAHELLVNAVTHGAAPVRVTLDGTATDVVVTVIDGSTQPARRLPYRPGLSENGLGLRLVAQLSAEWGQEQDGNGKRVWARIRRRALS